MHPRALLLRVLPASVLGVLSACGGGGGGGGPHAPLAPANVVATVNGTDVDLSWDASTGATEYRVYYDLVPGVVRTPATSLGSVSTAGAVVTGQPSVKAHFAVTAFGPGGESLLSNEVSAAIPPGGLDPLFGDAWHLLNTGQAGGTAGEDVNVTPAWTAGFDGTGARIAIVDEDLEIGHEDLFWNCLPGKSHNYVDGTTDPTGAANQKHGTSVAGVAAGVGGNDLGSRGAAFEAHLVGYNFLENQTTANEANSMVRDAAANWISNNSWGPTPGLGIPMPSTSTWRAAVQSGLATGRGGHGIVYLFAAGNGAQAGIDPGDNSNLGGYANFYGVMAIGAVGDDGTKAFYSENGANVFVCAPSLGHGNHAITTTDRTGAAGYNDGAQPFDYPDPNYTNTFSGTSSATPLVSGVVALVLQSNPNLGWRDVRAVLATSARKNDPLDPDWTTNAAGFHVNHKYGFGVVDAGAATTLAPTWTNFGPMTTHLTPASVPDLPIPDNDSTGVTDTIDVTGSGITYIEHVEIVFDAHDHTFSGDLKIVLTSPSGTESVLAETHDCPSGPAPYVNWPFGSVRCLGEAADGTWTLNVADGAPQDTGTFHSWSLKFRGH